MLDDDFGVEVDVCAFLLADVATELLDLGVFAALYVLLFVLALLFVLGGLLGGLAPVPVLVVDLKRRVW